MAALRRHLVVVLANRPRNVHGKNENSRLWPENKLVVVVVAQSSREVMSVVVPPEKFKLKSQLIKQEKRKQKFQSKNC